MQPSESRRRDVRPGRPVVQLDEGLGKRLRSYALAATAAGVGALGTPLGADASIIYAPVDIPIVPDQSVQFSLTNNGLNILSISNGGHVYCFSATCGIFMTLGGLGASEAAGLVTTRIGFYTFVASLQQGAVIGPADHFTHKANMGSFTSGQCFGPWACGRVGFLGARLNIDGKTHYGWVSLGVAAVPGGPLSPPGYGGEITGYAYQTNPNQSIVAGETPEPGTLGLLALGSLGLALWRRRNVATKG